MSKRTRRNARREAQRPLDWPYGPEVWGSGEYTVVVLHEGEVCPICAAFGGPPLAHSPVGGWSFTQNGDGPTLVGRPVNADPDLTERQR